MPLTEAFVDQMIANQHTAIRSYLVFTFVIVSAGIVVLIFGPRFAPEVGKAAIDIGGGLVTASSSFPITELISRKEKLGIFKEIRVQLQICHSDAGESDDRKRMDDLIWQAMLKTALA